MSGETPKDAVGFLCEDIKSAQRSRGIVIHLAPIFELFSKCFYIGEGEAIVVRHGNSDIYSDQESPLDALLLALLSPPLVVLC